MSPKIDSKYVKVNPSYRIVYILADNKPIASIEITTIPTALSNDEANNVAVALFVERLKEQDVARVDVNCKKEQVLASYQRYFKGEKD